MKISVQLYSLRDAGDFDTQLALARDCGYEWVESVGAHGLSAADFAQRVQSHGLRVSSMHAGLALLEGESETVLEVCRRTACALVVMPWLPMGERPASAAGWTALGRRLAAIGDVLRREGVALAYHNHDFEFHTYDGRCAIEWIFDAAAAQQLGWEADIGWVCRAGADPWRWLERFGDRLLAIHAKDIAASRGAFDEDGWCALGRGIVPWDKLLAHLAQRVELIVFEHDRPHDARTVLLDSRAFIARYLG